jgi:cyanate permease
VAGHAGTCVVSVAIAVADVVIPGTLSKEAAVRTGAITVMIDFFESKTFNAASVGALTTALSHYSDMSTWAAIGLALLVVVTFLLIFRNAHLELPMPGARLT